MPFPLWLTQLAFTTVRDLPGGPGILRSTWLARYVDSLVCCHATPELLVSTM